MTFALNLLAISSSGVEWSRPLMMAWLVIALALSVIEVWLTIRRRRSLTLAQGWSEATTLGPDTE